MVPRFDRDTLSGRTEREPRQARSPSRRRHGSIAAWGRRVRTGGAGIIVKRANDINIVGDLIGVTTLSRSCRELHQQAWGLAVPAVISCSTDAAARLPSPESTPGLPERARGCAVDRFLTPASGHDHGSRS